MKRLLAVAVFALGLLSGCGPAEGEEAVDTTATLGQELTPCLSACYGNCGYDSVCRADCRAQCTLCEAEPEGCVY